MPVVSCCDNAGPTSYLDLSYNIDQFGESRDSRSQRLCLPEL